MSDDWDEIDNMCPNCVTPWKCNGPHLHTQTEAHRKWCPPHDTLGALAPYEDDPSVDHEPVTT